MNYDVIGDIHGQAGKLEALLKKLGYTKKANLWVAPQDRQAIFLGDLIDRGPQQIQVVDIVRRMIDEGQAQSVMGNHEFNAIGFATQVRDRPGEYLRRRSAKKTEQHKEFLAQVGLDTALHHELVQWFKSLPVTLDLGGIRVVHAWWHDPYVSLVKENMVGGQPMSHEFIVASHNKGSVEFVAMEGLTKGLEVTLPSGHSFFDQSGIERHEVRTKWWQEQAKTFREVAILDEQQHHRIPDHPLPADYLGGVVSGSPVIVGHYWMKGTPELQATRLACVDYSAAKDGPLVCYQWSGEQELSRKNFVEAGLA
jgi:hypothetical protein